mmetsp:Transcript_39994/g.63505  ORF Transcript_39994/g.63505 Transcript_39994/m.63505 type:complete len:231 (-) Transcript_39994:2472-3164(-)
MVTSADTPSFMPLLSFRTFDGDFKLSNKFLVPLPLEDDDAPFFGRGEANLADTFAGASNIELPVLSSFFFAVPSASTEGFLLAGLISRCTVKTIGIVFLAVEYSAANVSLFVTALPFTSTISSCSAHPKSFAEGWSNPTTCMPFFSFTPSLPSSSFGTVTFSFFFLVSLAPAAFIIPFVNCLIEAFPFPRPGADDSFLFPSMPNKPPHQPLPPPPPELSGLLWLPVAPEF